MCWRVEKRIFLSVSSSRNIIHTSNIQKCFLPPRNLFTLLQFAAVSWSSEKLRINFHHNMISNPDYARYVSVYWIDIFVTLEWRFYRMKNGNLLESGDSEGGGWWEKYGRKTFFYDKIMVTDWWYLDVNLILSYWQRMQRI